MASKDKSHACVRAVMACTTDARCVLASLLAQNERRQAQVGPVNLLAMSSEAGSEGAHVKHPFCMIASRACRVSFSPCQKLRRYGGTFFCHHRKNHCG